MRRWVIIFLSFFIMSSLKAMESKKEETSSSNHSFLDLLELRLLIVQALLRTVTSDTPLKCEEDLELKEALKSIKAFFLTDSTACLRLKSSYATKSFIDCLENCSYETNVEISKALLKIFNPLLDQSSSTALLTCLQEREGLITLFKKCSEKPDWSEASSMLTELKKNEWWNKAVNYHWTDESGYQGDPAKKNCLSAALESNAPLTIINELLTLKPRMSSFHPCMPSPLLILCDKLIEQYEKLYFDCYDLDIEALTKSEKPQEKNLREICALMNTLLEHKASLNDSFSFIAEERLVPVIITPLSRAASHCSLKMIDYLIKHGSALNSEHPLLFALCGTSSDKQRCSRYAIVSALIKAPFNDSALDKALCGLFGHYSTENRHKEFYSQQEFSDIASLLIEMLIKQNISSARKKKVLEVARICHMEDIAQLLIEKGFAEAFQEDERGRVTLDFHEKSAGLMNAYISSEADPVQFERFLKDFFLYTHDLLERDLIEQQALSPLLSLFLEFGSLEETRNLLLYLSTKKPLSIELGELKVLSVLRLLILTTCGIKKVFGSDFLQGIYIEIYSLISWLIEKGVQDTVFKGEKTAAQLAYEEELSELGDCITYSLKDWLTPVAGLTAEEKKELLLSMHHLIQNEGATVEMGYVISLALSNSSMLEARDLLLWAALQEPFLLKGIYCRNAPSVFHVMVECLAAVKQNSLELFQQLLPGVIPCVHWLKAQGISDGVKREGSTASERASELGVFEIAEALLP